MTDVAVDTVALKLSDVWKRFDGVAALKGVSLEVLSGEVHALLGENGAGKSTLMSAAVGSLQPDQGQIEVLGRVVENLNPQLAQKLGIAIVYQHPALAPDLSVFENMAMALGPQMREHGGEAKNWVAAQLAEVGCTAGLNDRVSDLAVAQRQLIEIAKALAAGPSIMILDEPTASLGAGDAEMLFSHLRRLASNGVAIIYITHRLAEVRALCDRVTVLRDGEMRGTFTVSDVSDAQILELIVGREVFAEFPPKAGLLGNEIVLEVRDLNGLRFHDANFIVRKGEVLGIGGIVGNGQSELIRALAGLETAVGTIEVNRKEVRISGPGSARDAGVVYLSSDRLSEGLFPTMSVRENAAVSTVDRFARFGFVRRRAEAQTVKEKSTELAVKASSIEANVLELSGGNQQKVLMSRALLNEGAHVLLADDPTQGVDVGARLEIYRVLRRVADEGVAVVVVSSDVRELEGLCDRVLVVSAGRLVAEFSGQEVQESRITNAMLSSTARRSLVGDSKGKAPGRTPRFFGRVTRVAKGDYGATWALAIIMVAISLYTQGHNARFMTSFNLNSLGLLVAALAFISFGQACVIMTGGIDLSVGPLAGLVVVIGSFYENSGRSVASLALGFVVMFVVSALVGLANGLMVQSKVFTPVAATLVSYIALQGISLVMRPFQGGYIANSVMNAINQGIGAVPIAFVLAVLVAIALEISLRRSRWGRGLRAVGSDVTAAFRLGVRTDRSLVGAYVASALLSCVGGIMLMAQIGVGDPSQGVNYTLASVTAVVLAGTSVFGGRGSFVGVLLGAVLVEELLNVTTFLNLSQPWQYWFQGVLVFVAVGIYARAQARGTSRRMLRRHLESVAA